MNPLFYRKKTIPLSSILTKVLLYLLLIHPSIKALSFKEVFEKGDLKCTTKYTITGMLPIEITREYKEGQTDFLIIRKIWPEDAEEVYKFVDKNRKHLKPYLPFIVEDFGESEEKTKYTIKGELEKMDRGFYYKLGVFYKPTKDAKPIFVAFLGTHSFQNSCNGSLDGMYGIGYSHQGRGIVSTAIKAFFNHLIATTDRLIRLNLVMEKENIASERVAIKVGMKQVSSDDYNEWGGYQKKNEILIYSLPVSEWKKIHWPKSKLSS